jgi:threonine dehydrogenase-like Zn-dependent dehydrogenase
MRAALFKAPRSIEVGERPDASISEPTDAVVRVALACVCGSDLWYHRGDSPFEPGPIGHEFMGVVEDVGSDVENIRKGDFVIAPFAFSDGTCPHCRHGVTSACVAGGFFPMNGDDGMRLPRFVVSSVVNKRHPHKLRRGGYLRKPSRPGAASSARP